MVLSVMILPLINIGISYLHYIYLVLIIIILLPYLKKSTTRKNNLFIWGFIFFTLLLSFLTPLITHIIFRTVFEATLVYILPVLFWVLFYTKFPAFNLRKFLNFSVFIALIISIFGFIQFFFSKTIFGLIPDISYYDIDFTQESLVSSGSIFRVRSILPSSQIFGLYTALSFCLSTHLFKKKKIHLLTVTTPILFASLLSGQRIVILVYLVYFLLSILSQSRNIIKSIIKIFFFSIVIMFALDIVNDILVSSGMASTRLLDVFTDFSSVVDYEQSARWTLWFDLIKNTNPILGNGIGYTFPLEDGTRVVTSESYIVQLYFEGGLLMLLSFLVLYYNSLKNSIKQPSEQFKWPILVALFAALLVVHAFTNPIFFAYWGVIIYPLLTRKT